MSAIAERRPLAEETLGWPEAAEILEFRVHDEFSRAVQGARVKSIRGESYSDCAGLVRVPWSPNPAGHSGVGAQWSCNKIIVSAKGSVPLELSPLRNRPTAVWLSRGKRISGRCTDSSGRPLQGFRLAEKRAWSVIRGERRNETFPVFVTDETGWFETHEAPAQVLEFVAGAKDWITRVERVVPPADHLKVVAYRPARISGRVLSPTSNQLSNWTIYRELAVVPDGGLPLRVEGDGEFRVDYCLPGPIEIRWGRQVLARLVLREGEERTGLNLVAPESTEAWKQRAERAEREKKSSEAPRSPAPRGGAHIRGSVVTPTGETLPYGRVSVRVAGTRTEVRAAGGRGELRFLPPDVMGKAAGSRFSGGRFETAPVPSGSYDLIWETSHQPDLAVLRRRVRMPNPPRDLDLGQLIAEVKPVNIRVRLLAGREVSPANAIVRLVDGSRSVAAARADVRGMAVMRTHVADGLFIEVDLQGTTVARKKIPFSVAAGDSNGCITVSLK